MESSYALAKPSPPISCPTKISWYPPPPSWVKVNVDMARSSSKASVRLNLFNHVLALFHAKFTCNSAIRNPIFSWELCKGCVWDIVKIWWTVCNQRASRNWLASGDLLEISHVWSMQKVERSWPLDHYWTKTYSLTFLLVGN